MTQHTLSRGAQTPFFGRRGAARVYFKLSLDITIYHLAILLATIFPMAYSSRPTSMLPGAPGGSSLRQPSGSQSQQSSALSARIAAKKAELENLRQLRDLSGTLAMQMQALENKVSTLKDGTEGCPTCVP